MKKVLLNFTGRTNGAPVYAYEMAKGLLGNGVEVYAVISKQIDNLSDWKKLPLKKLILIDTYTDKKSFLINTVKFFLWGKNIIKRELEGIELDIVYCTMPTYWMGIINNMFRDVRQIITLHDPIQHSGESFFNRILQYSIRYEVKKSYRVVILSSIFKKVLENDYNKKENEIIVLPHGVINSYKDNAGSIPLIEYAENKTNFMFFGRIEDYKGLDILIKAYKMLEAEIPDKSTLTIAGAGDFTRYMRDFNQLYTGRLINRKILDEEVLSLFTGQNVITMLPYKDATQSGNVNIAGMNKSLVIASDTGGLSEQLGYGKYGILVRPNDVNELYLAMKSVVENRDKYNILVEELYQYMNSISWEALAKTILDEV